MSRAPLWQLVQHATFPSAFTTPSGVIFAQNQSLLSESKPDTFHMMVKVSVSCQRTFPKALLHDNRSVRKTTREALQCRLHRSVDEDLCERSVGHALSRIPSTPGNCAQAWYGSVSVMNVKSFEAVGESVAINMSLGDVPEHPTNAISGAATSIRVQTNRAASILDSPAS